MHAPIQGPMIRESWFGPDSDDNNDKNNDNDNNDNNNNNNTKVKATIPLTRRTLVQRRWGQFIHKFL